MLQGLLRPAAAAAGRHCRISLPLPLPLWAPRGLASLRQDAALHTSAHSSVTPASKTVRGPGLQSTELLHCYLQASGRHQASRQAGDWARKLGSEVVLVGACHDDDAGALGEARRLVSESPVTLFTKTYCPYSRKVKELMAELGVNATIIDLDVRPDGDLIQAALTAGYDQSTMPYVFVGGKLIGGCDVVLALYESGQLKPLLQAVGALPQDQTA
eukprot:SM000002S05583  [mRNA]  locus=s2:1070997:1072188:+ [translate_table: standard]